MKPVRANNMDMEQGNLPKVSVVIPAKNEARFIARCLASLRSSTFPAEKMEIIVADNGSTDDTLDIARSFGVQTLSVPNRFVGAVRNAGARELSAPIIAFIDADCEAPDSWLNTGVQMLKYGGVGLVGGGYLPNPAGTWVERAWADSRPKTLHDTGHLPGGSIIIKRDVFDSLGGFDEKLSAGEDDDICRRARQAGYRVISAPECYVTHLGYPSTLRDVARRQVWHGSYQLQASGGTPDSQLILTHSFLTGAIMLPLSLVIASPTAAALALLFLSTPVTLLSLKKSTKRTRPVRSFLKMIPVSAAFYAGRSYGLLKSYVLLVRER